MEQNAVFLRNLTTNFRSFWGSPELSFDSLLLPFGKIHLGEDIIDAHFTHKPHGSEAAGSESL